MIQARNIILITGPFADGKTKLIQALQAEFAMRRVPFESKVITDATYLLEAIAWDDQVNRGVNHMHSETGLPVAHSHNGSAPDYDFVATGRAIQEYMFAHFFDELSVTRPSDRYYFAELAGGRGIHPETHPAVLNDYSYLSMVSQMTMGRYKSAWTRDVAYVIHPHAPYESRRAWNEDRRLHPPGEVEIAKGFVSWPVPDVVMRNTGIDDFEELQTFLESQGVPPSRIETIENNGGPDFFSGPSRGSMKQLDRGLVKRDVRVRLQVDGYSL